MYMDASKRVVRRFAARPNVYKLRALRLKEVLIGGIDDDYIKTLADGKQVQRQWLVDLDAVLEVVDLLDDEDEEVWVHWCYVRIPLSGREFHSISHMGTIY